MNEVWGDIFTHVHWDQRGTDKTLRQNRKTDMLVSVDQRLGDLLGIIGHLQQKWWKNRLSIKENGELFKRQQFILRRS